MISGFTRSKRGRNARNSKQTNALTREKKSVGNSPVKLRNEIAEMFPITSMYSARTTFIVSGKKYGDKTLFANIHTELVISG